MAFFSVVFAVTQIFLGESAHSQVHLGWKSLHAIMSTLLLIIKDSCYLCVSKSISFCCSKWVMSLGGGREKRTTYMLDYKEFKL